MKDWTPWYDAREVHPQLGDYVQLEMCDMYDDTLQYVLEGVVTGFDAQDNYIQLCRPVLFDQWVYVCRWRKLLPREFIGETHRQEVEA